MLMESLFIEQKLLDEYMSYVPKEEKIEHIMLVEGFGDGRKVCFILLIQ